MPGRRIRSAVVCLFIAGVAACSSKRSTPRQAVAPTITFVTPGPGDSLHGVVPIFVTATGEGAIVSLAFTAPPALANVTPSLASGTHGATLEANLDLAPFTDGPLTVTVTARDEFGATATKDLTVAVAQRAPSIVVLEPSGGSSVAGTIAISATATAQAGAALASLALLDPPAGCTVDADSAASSLSITWDTTRALEGPVPLRFRAVDSTGLSFDRTLIVAVDNVPLGRLDAYVSAGGPVQDATVDVYALDDATGAVSTTVGSSGLLGSAGPTDASGHVQVLLSTENYRGPILIKARSSGGAPLRYIDPTGTAQVVEIPNTLPLTSTIGAYSTGNAVDVPVTLWTSLADAEIAAYAGGSHRQFPTRHTVSEAVSFVDGLFAAHLQASTPRWDLRTAIPAPLTAPYAPGLDARAYAALADVGLSQLARDLGVAGNVSGVTAPYLAELLRRDLLSDGQFDGKGDGGAQLLSVGSPPVALSEDELRVKLANALDAFLRSPRNLSGLTREHLATAAVFSAIAGDVSPLFGSRSPAPYDSQGPVVTIAATYGDANVAPVGDHNLVRGTIRVVVSATDASGIQSIALGADGTQVQGTLTAGTGAASFVATYDTAARPDGLLTFTAVSSDARGNAGTGTYAVTIDNSGPTIAVASPSATAFYAGAIPLGATAADGSGIASCGETTRGVADDDGTASRYQATWTPPGDMADGPLTLQFQACDVVGNCRAQPFTVRRDHTPPTVTSAATPSAYTTSVAARLDVAATDSGGSGVAAAYARPPGGADIAASWTGTAWTIRDVPLSEGPNAIMVWAVDGAGNAGPAQAVTITRDTGAPAPYPRFDAVSYQDERYLNVTSPTVPSYAFSGPGMTRVAVASVGHVYKAASRLAWRATPTASDLEGSNPDNLPWLQFAVPTGSTEAPLAAATYTITLDGYNSWAVTGDLTPWRSASSTPTTAYYDLPLTSDVYPLLASATSTAAIAIHVSASFTDAAGNTGSTTPLPVQFHVVGPPLHVAEDAAYANGADAKSTHHWTRSAGNYGTLFDTSSTVFVPNETVRLLHYLVSNPSPVAAALDVPSFTWSLSESWAADNSTLPNTLVTSSPTPRDSYWGCTAQPSATAALCWGGTTSFFEPATQAGYPYSCPGSFPAVSPTTLTFATTPSVEAYLWANGADAGAASRTSSGRIIVPAGATVSLYLVRSRNSATTTRSIPLAGAAPSYTQSFGTYYTYLGGLGSCYNQGHYYASFTPSRRARYLSAAVENLVGTFAPSTWALTPGNLERGESLTATTSLPLTRAIPK